MSTRTRRPNISIDDLMDITQVAEAFGVTTSSVRVALNKPDQFRALADKLPAPLGKLNSSWVWLRYDVEKVVNA